MKPKNSPIPIPLRGVPALDPGSGTAATVRPSHVRLPKTTFNRLYTSLSPPFRKLTLTTSFAGATDTVVGADVVPRDPPQISQVVECGSLRYVHRGQATCFVVVVVFVVVAESGFDAMTAEVAAVRTIPHSWHFGGDEAE